MQAVAFVNPLHEETGLGRGKRVFPVPWFFGNIQGAVELTGGIILDSRLGLPVNTLLDGSYRIARVVGSGGFGITYEAEDINLGTAVAIKEILSL